MYANNLALYNLLFNITKTVEVKILPNILIQIFGIRYKLGSEYNPNDSNDRFEYLIFYIN